MTSYEVYATRFDDPHVVEELIPARDLSFSLPLNDHGEASFTATAEPGRSFWRPAISTPVSGILIARDGVPVWQGWVTDEDETGDRTFSFQCREWGHFFEEKVPAVPRDWEDTNDHEIQRELIRDALAVSGQNLRLSLGTSTGAQTSDWSVKPWDDTTVGRELRAIGDAAGGPEWYFGTAGTLDNPVRQFVQGDRLGQVSAQTVLEFVEDTEDYRAPDGPPTVALLGGFFTGPAPQVPTRRAGGNLIAKKRRQSVADAATVVRASGAGEERARLVRTAVASRLLANGWPRVTTVRAYSDVTYAPTLQRHADADLAAVAGIPTGYSLVSLDGDPSADWLQTPRGSTVRVVLDTDVYGAERPIGGANGFDARLLNLIVRVPDAGSAQVEWVTSMVQEF